MSWKLSEREIFKIEVDGVELKFDPVRCILRYNKAVAEAGGLAEYKKRWMRYHRAPLPALPEGATDEQIEERSDQIHANELQDSEDCIYLAEIGAKTVDMPLFDQSTHVEGKPQLTVKQGRDVIYRYIEFMTKKESGEETSTLQNRPVSPPSGETSEAGPSTLTS